MEQKKILYADDDPEIREALQLLLSCEGYETIAATNGEEVLQLLDDSIDLVILDVMMPVMNGFTTCAEIRKRSAVPILFLTAKSQESDMTLGFSAGGDDYLVKPFDIQEVLLRIRVLLRRNSTEEKNALSDEVLNVGDIEIYPETLESVIVNKKVKLTPTEFEILYCLMQHFNNPVTLAVLLDEVWGYESNEDVRMLRVHVGGLRNKIEPNPKQPKYLHTVTNVGYKLTPFGEE